MVRPIMRVRHISSRGADAAALLARGLLCSALLACADAEPSGSEDSASSSPSDADDSAPATSSATTDATQASDDAATSDGTGGDSADTSDGSGDTGSDACATETPCAADSDCVALAGTRCNLALAAPRCAQLQCGQPEAPCSDVALCELGLVCVDPEQPALEETDPYGVCLTVEAARDVCVASCQSAPPQAEFSVCDLAEAQILCEYACSLYPDDPMWPCGDSFGFVSRACLYSAVDPTACFADLVCPGVGGTALQLIPCE